MTDQTQERRPGANRTANSTTEKDTSSIPPEGIDPWLDPAVRRWRGSSRLLAQGGEQRD